MNNFGKNIFPLTTDIKISIPDSPHFLVVGQTGSGKTMAISYLMLAMTNKDPSYGGINAKVYIIDSKRSDLFSLHKVLQYGDERVAAEPPKIAKLLRTLVTNMNNRYTNNFSDITWGATYETYGLRPILLVWDEVASTLAECTKKEQTEIIGYLKQLILKGRQQGFYVLLGTQRMSADVLSRDLTLQLGTRIVMGQADKDTLKMTFPTSDLDSIPRYNTEKAHGLVFISGKGWSTPRPFCMPDMTNFDVKKALKRTDFPLKPTKFYDEPYWIGA